MTYILSCGFEIEGAGITPEFGNRALARAGIKGWMCKEDGSDGVDIEIMSCPMAFCPSAFNSLKSVCDLLESIGCVVNVGCGLHIHIGNAPLKDGVTREAFTKESIAYFENTNGELYTNHAEPFDVAIVKDVAIRYTRSALQPNGVNACLAKSRRDDGNGNHNKWARLTPLPLLEAANTVEELIIASTLGRSNYSRKYSAVNFKAWANGTVEFRQHQGTIDACKIWNWGLLLENLFQHSLNNRFTSGTRTSVTETPSIAPFVNRSGGRIIDQYNLMRVAGGCTTRDIMMITGCSEGSVRRAASLIRDRLEENGFPRLAVIQHDQISNGHRYGDGTDLNGYEIAIEVTVQGIGAQMLPENSIGNASIWAGVSDEQYQWWKDRIVALA